MKSAKSDSNNDVKLVRNKLIINGTTLTHKDILEESDAKESGREPTRKKLYPFMKSAKSDSNNDVKLVGDKLIINGTTFTHTDIREESDAKESGRKPKNDRPHRPTVATNIGWGIGQAANRCFRKIRVQSRN